MTPRTKVGIQAPDVTLGGTMPFVLRAERMLVIDAARGLLSALSGCCPHARDYADSVKYDRAVSRHALHVDMVKALISENESIVEAILDQEAR